ADLEPEGRSMAVGTGHRRPTAVRLSHGSYDRESQPRPAEAPVTGLVDPVETVEHVLERAAGDALAAVADDEREPALRGLGRHLDLVPLARVADRVLEQRVERKHHAVAVDSDGAVRHRAEQPLSWRRFAPAVEQ